MPLTAIFKDTGETICPVQIQHRERIDRNQIASGLRNASLLCPYCKKLGLESLMTVVNAPGKRLHFRHLPQQSNTGHCPGKNKSDDHINIQAEFGLWLEREEGGTVIQEYQKLPDRVRIPDILHEEEDGVKTVYEVQLSGITSDVLAARTKDYHDLGLKVVWMLGKKALTSENKDWCDRTLGGFIELTPDREGYGAAA